MTIAVEAASGVDVAAENTGASKNEPYVGVSAGRMAILVACARPDTATISTPSGWTLIGDQTGGVLAVEPSSGTGHVYAWYRQLDGSEVGNVAVAGAGVNTLESAMTVYSTTGTWTTPALVSGSGPGAHANNRSVTCGSWTLATGDYVQLAFGSDRGAITAVTAYGLTQSGATFGSVTERNRQISVFQNDVTVLTADCSVTAGSTGAPTITFTQAATNCGPGVAIRLRESGATTNASAAAATATTAAAANPGVSPTAGSSATAAAQNASSLIGAAATNATAAAAALTPSLSVRVSAECATAAGTANPAVFTIPSHPSGTRITSTSPRGRIGTSTQPRITTTSPRGWL